MSKIHISPNLHIPTQQRLTTLNWIPMSIVETFCSIYSISIHNKFLLYFFHFTTVKNKKQLKKVDSTLLWLSRFDKFYNLLTSLSEETQKTLEKTHIASSEGTMNININLSWVQKTHFSHVFLLLLSLSSLWNIFLLKNL